MQFLVLLPTTHSQLRLLLAQPHLHLLVQNLVLVLLQQQLLLVVLLHLLVVLACICGCSTQQAGSRSVAWHQTPQQRKLVQQQRPMWSASGARAGWHSQRCT